MAHRAQWDHPCRIRATHGAADRLTILASVILGVVWIEVSRAIDRIIILSFHPLATDATHFLVRFVSLWLSLWLSLRFSLRFSLLLRVPLARRVKPVHPRRVCAAHRAANVFTILASVIL